MEQIPEPRRRLNVVTKAKRRRRIFARLREGWAYDEIAREERVSAERIRQIVSGGSRQAGHRPRRPTTRICSSNA